MGSVPEHSMQETVISTWKCRLHIHRSPKSHFCTKIFSVPSFAAFCQKFWSTLAEIEHLFLMLKWWEWWTESQSLCFGIEYEFLMHKYCSWWEIRYLQKGMGDDHAVHTRKPTHGRHSYSLALRSCALARRKMKDRDDMMRWCHVMSWDAKRLWKKQIRH